MFFINQDKDNLLDCLLHSMMKHQADPYEIVHTKCPLNNEKLLKKYLARSTTDLFADKVRLSFLSRKKN